MAKIIAVTNQKGGVGKTSTVLNLGAGLTMKGNKVLFVDMDPQCSLTYAIGAEMDTPGALEVLTSKCSITEVIQHTESGDILCASTGLSSVDQQLNESIGREYKLKTGLSPVVGLYDYIVIDSPPTLGILTVNILTACDYVVIPALADIFSLQGVGQLYATMEAVKTYCNPSLQIAGILLTRHTERFILNREMREMLEETSQQIGTRVFTSTIREAVAIRESQASRQSIFKYAPRSKQAADFDSFINELLSDINH